MLDLLRENQAAPQEAWGPQKAWGGCEGVVFEASRALKILDPVLGDKELVKAVAINKAKLISWLSSVAELRQQQ